jgi:DNA-binding transcriptional ArsR family regulator
LREALDITKLLSAYYDIITMGLSKKRSFGTRENQIAEIAKALAHPARVAILQFLAKENACLCGDIVEHIPLSQATVSQHLAESRARLRDRVYATA